MAFLNPAEDQGCRANRHVNIYRDGTTGGVKATLGSPAAARRVAHVVVPMTR